jgi:AraC-like DNA-binding protein
MDSKIHIGSQRRLDVGSATREEVIHTELLPSLRNWGIRFCGLSEAREGFLFVRPVAAMRQVLACLGGTGVVWMDDEWKPCTAGMVYATVAGKPHAYRAVGSEPWRLVWVIYEPPVSPEEEPLAGEKENLLLSCDPGLLESAVRGLLSQNRTAPGDQACLNLWTELVHLHACRLCAPEQGDARLRRAWRIAETFPAETITLARLAKEACISQEHFRRICLKELGCTPMRHLLVRRLHQAAHQLRNTNLKVASIARICGFRSTAGFNAAFKKVYRVTPSGYRHAKPRKS